jgi:hypothetical protein
MDILKFFVFFSFYVHPGDKKYGLVDPHGGHQFFQSARAVREIRCPSGNFKSPSAKS